MSPISNTTWFWPRLTVSSGSSTRPSDASQLLEGTGGHVRLDRTPERRFEWSVLDAQAEEPVATIVSSWPPAEMRTPVSTGRVSSFEADRATCRAVSTKTWVGSVMRVSGAGPGSVGKSSERSVRSWNLAEPEITSTSCSCGRSSIVTVSPGSERATSSTSRAGSTENARLKHLRLERHAQSDLHVGGEQHGAVAFG